MQVGLVFPTLAIMAELAVTVAEDLLGDANAANDLDAYQLNGRLERSGENLPGSRIVSPCYFGNIEC